MPPEVNFSSCYGVCFRLLMSGQWRCFGYLGTIGEHLH